MIGAVVLALVSISSWPGGAVVCWAALYWVWGETSSRGDLMAMGFWTLLLLVFGLPFHVRTVSILVKSGVNPWRRIATATVWAAVVAIGTAVLLTALLGRGRPSDVLTPEGQLLLVWASTTTVVFAALGSIASYLGVWIERRE